MIKIGKNKERLTYGAEATTHRSAMASSNGRTSKLCLSAALMLVWCAIASASIGFTAEVIVAGCRTRPSEQIFSNISSFGCVSEVGFTLIPFVILRYVVLLDLGHPSLRHQFLCYLAWSITVIAEFVAVLIMLGVTVLLSSLNAFVIGQLTFWMASVIISGLLPAIIFSRWQQWSDHAAPRRRAIEIRKHTYERKDGDGFRSVRELLQGFQHGQSHQIEGVTAQADGWVIASQRRLASLLGISLSAVHEEIQKLKDHDDIDIDTSTGVTRLRLLQASNCAIPNSSDVETGRQVELVTNSQHSEKQDETEVQNASTKDGGTVK